MAEQVIVKIQTLTVKQDAQGSEATSLLDAKELQVQLTCGDFETETEWKTSGSSFLFEKELALQDNELEFMIFGRGGALGNVGLPVARALEERGGKLTECDKDTPDKLEHDGRRKSLKLIELKLVPPGDAATPSIGTLVIFLNAPKGSQPPPTASATAQPATSSETGGGGTLLAVPEAGLPTAGGASGGSGGVGMEGWEAAAQAADAAADEAEREQSLPELSHLFAELHKLRSDLKKEQRVLEHREHESLEAEEALDNAREQVLERTTYDLLLTTHHSPLTTHHSSLTTHHSPLTTYYSLLATRYLLGIREGRRAGGGPRAAPYRRRRGPQALAASSK